MPKSTCDLQLIYILFYFICVIILVFHNFIPESGEICLIRRFKTFVSHSTHVLCILGDLDQVSTRSIAVSALVFMAHIKFGQ